MGEHGIRCRDLLLNLGIRYLLQGLIGADSKCGGPVGRDSSTGVGAGFQNALSLPLAGVDAPFVDGTVHTTGYDLTIILRPDDAPDFAVVALEVANILKSVRSVELDNVSVYRREQVSSVAELTLKG